MRLLWMAAAAMAAMPGVAMAQDAPRKVFFTTPGIAVFVPETVAGPENRRTLDLLMVFADPVDDGDVHLNPFVVDCTTQFVQPLNGRAYMGSKFVKETATGEEPAKAKPGSMELGIALYACSGQRVSKDEKVVRTFQAAIDYGRKIGAK